MSDTDNEASGSKGSSNRDKPRKKLKTGSNSVSLSKLSATIVEQFCAVDFNDLVWEEKRNISDFFEVTKTPIPDELSGDIYQLLHKKIRVDGYPSELMNETLKTSYFHDVFVIVIQHFQKQFTLSEEQLIPGREVELNCSGHRAKMGYAAVLRIKGYDQKANKLRDQFLFVVEVKTEGPRHASRQLVAYLDTVRMLNPGLKVIK